MAILINNINEYNVEFASDTDVCDYCLKEFIKNEENPSGLSTVMLKKKLEGDLTGQKVFKLKHGLGITICKKHLEKILNEVKGEE